MIPMKINSSPCCGSYSQRKTKEVNEPLPTNPKVNGGVEVIYLGAGNIEITGAGTASLYYASDHRRHIKVHKEDLESVLKHKAVILKP